MAKSAEATWRTKRVMQQAEGGRCATAYLGNDVVQVLRLKELSRAQVYRASVDGDAVRKHKFECVFVGGRMNCD
jgi:hypothetical protein